MTDYRPIIREGEAGRISRNYQEPSDELIEAFEDYLEKTILPPLDILESSRGHKASIKWRYQKAKECLEGINPKPYQANSLVFLFKEEDREDEDWRGKVGIFLSAAYNQSEEEIIVYDSELENPLRYLGYKLPAEKTLILEGDTEHKTSFKSEGTTINRAFSSSLGKNSSGLNINLGQSENLVKGDVLLNFGDTTSLNENFCHESIGSSRILANFGQARQIKSDYYKRIINHIKDNGIVSYRGQLVCPGGNNDERFRDYLLSLEKNLNDDLGAVIDFLEERQPNPKAEIENKLNRLIEQELGDLGDSD